MSNVSYCSSFVAFVMTGLVLLVVIMQPNRYGDIKPSSDLSRVVVAIYAMLVVNVTGSVLSVSREYLESLCRVPSISSSSSSSVLVDATHAVADQKQRKKKKKRKKKIA
jgi:hypothetical protein